MKMAFYFICVYSFNYPFQYSKLSIFCYKTIFAISVINNIFYNHCSLLNYNKHIIYADVIETKKI